MDKVYLPEVAAIVLLMQSVVQPFLMKLRLENGLRVTHVKLTVCFAAVRRIYKGRLVEFGTQYEPFLFKPGFPRTNIPS